MSICDDTTLLSTSRPRTSATAVSSQLVSIANTVAVAPDLDRVLDIEADVATDIAGDEEEASGAASIWDI